MLSLPPFGGVCPFAPLPAGFRRLLWPPLIDHRLVTCLWTCKCKLYGLCHKKGLFHGMQHSYATPFDMGNRRWSIAILLTCIVTMVLPHWGVAESRARSCRGKLSCSTTHATGCTYKSRGTVVGGVQTLAAIANEESLQVRVRKSHPGLNFLQSSITKSLPLLVSLAGLPGLCHHPPKLSSDENARSRC